MGHFFIASPMAFFTLALKSKAKGIVDSGELTGIPPAFLAIFFRKLGIDFSAKKIYVIHGPDFSII